MKIRTLLLTTLLTASTLATATDVDADTKIGFVNVNRIMRDSGMAVKLSKKLEKDFAPREAEIKKAIVDFKNRQAEFEKNALTLPESERNKRQQDLLAEQREIERKRRDFQESLHQARNDAAGQLQEKARKIVLEVAEKEHFDLVIEENGVIYVSNKIDITDRVMKLLEK
jgi:outer membrane protein